MISIAYQANIGCYFFSYLLARWLASIRADVINLPQHPLLHLQNTNNRNHGHPLKRETD
jgi:hypothetical protein